METAVQPRRKSPAGESTSDLICSAHLGSNEQLFPHILDLHVPHGSTVADVTYGKGVFWKRVEDGAYNLLATDIETGVDCRDLPYADESIDCVVLDPPIWRASTGSRADRSLAAVAIRHSGKPIPTARPRPKGRDTMPPSSTCI